MISALKVSHSFRTEEISAQLGTYSMQKLTYSSKRCSQTGNQITKFVQRTEVNVSDPTRNIIQNSQNTPQKSDVALTLIALVITTEAECDDLWFNDIKHLNL